MLSKTYFFNIASNFQSSVKYSKNNFHDFRLPVSINSLFLESTDVTEVKITIMYLNLLKAIAQKVFQLML